MTRYAVPDVAPQHPHSTEIVIRRSRFVAQCAHTPDAVQTRILPLLKQKKNGC